MKKVLIFMVGFLFMVINLYAADGDFIVDGNLGVGTATPGEKLEIDTGHIGLSSQYHLKGRTVAGPYRRLIGLDGDNLVQIAGDGDTAYIIGNVGIGTRTPDEKLHVVGGNIKLDSNRHIGWNADDGGVAVNYITSVNASDHIAIHTKNAERMRIDSAGNVGIGTDAPAPNNKLEVAGNIYATGSITPGSSRELKENILDLSVQEAFETLKDLSPVKFNYKVDKEKDLHVGFIAEDVPEMVAVPSRKGVSSMDIVAVLTKVVQEQQKEITALKAEQQTMKNQQAMISALFEEVKELKRQANLKATVAFSSAR